MFSMKNVSFLNICLISWPRTEKLFFPSNTADLWVKNLINGKIKAGDFNMSQLLRGSSKDLISKKFTNNCTTKSNKGFLMINGMSILMSPSKLSRLLRIYLKVNRKHKYYKKFKEISVLRCGTSIWNTMLVSLLGFFKQADISLSSGKGCNIKYCRT